MNLKDQITNIFVQIDDFYKEFGTQIKKLKQNIRRQQEKKKQNPQKCLILKSIMIGFHPGAHKTFKHYYQEIVCGYWKDLFPIPLSYNRFVELQPRQLFGKLFADKGNLSKALWEMLFADGKNFVKKKSNY